MRRVADGYLVGECGRVWSEKTQSWLRPEVMRKGYLRVKLYDGVVRRGRKVLVHRLVAAAYLPPAPSDDHQINHKDGDKGNNTPGNLEWSTCVENINHAIDTGLRVRCSVAGWQARA